MKFILPILLVFAVSQSVFASTTENKNFSGAFEVQSCAPSCDQVFVGSPKYIYSFDFSTIDGMRISVVDNTDIAWATCDGSKKAFEFNVWAYGKNKTGHFMNNNLKGDSLNPWRNVCDGKFAVSGNSVSLSSPDISLKLKKLTDEKFQLEWTDKRWGVSGGFNLKKADF